MPISRKAVRYKAQRTIQEATLVKRLKQLGEQYPRYGYLMLHELLRREGLV
jgi:putative transposase